MSHFATINDVLKMPSNLVLYDIISLNIWKNIVFTVSGVQVRYNNSIPSIILSMLLNLYNSKNVSLLVIVVNLVTILFNNSAEMYASPFIISLSL